MSQAASKSKPSHDVSVISVPLSALAADPANPRKLGKTHQNVLVFVKGDARKAADACGPVEIVEMEPSNEESADV